jgi:excinuclease UvrABC nuclease subunit
MRPPTTPSSPTSGSDSELVDQLQQQLKAERAQRKFDAARCEEQIVMLLKALRETRLELARRDTRDAFASVPNLSAIRH